MTSRTSKDSAADKADSAPLASGEPDDRVDDRRGAEPQPTEVQTPAPAPTPTGEAATGEALARIAYRAFCESIPASSTPWNLLPQDTAVAWIAAAEAASRAAVEADTRKEG